MKNMPEEKIHNNITEIVFVIDRSGSMHGLEKDTVGGFNSVIDEQKEKKENGKVLISTVLFNSESVVIHDRVDIEEIQPMKLKDYRVGGCTAMLDAIGDAIKHIGLVHKYARSEDRPEHTMFFIITDGMENASHKYTLHQINEKIERQKTKYEWEFVFLGANIDALDTAEDLGIEKDNAADFCCDSIGVNLNFKAMSKAIDCARQGAPLQACWKEEIDEDFTSRGRKK